MPPAPHLPPHDQAAANHHHANALANNQQPQQQQQQQQQQQGRQRQREHSTMQILLLLFSGFMLGVSLSLLWTTLVLCCVPARFLDNALRLRRERVEEVLSLRRMCKGASIGGGAEAGAGGFVERYDAVENVVQICTCWPKGMYGWAGGLAGWMVTCTSVELSGWGELGTWGLGGIGDT